MTSLMACYKGVCSSGCQIWRSSSDWHVQCSYPVLHVYVAIHRTKYSLNALSHDTAKKLIRRVLDDGVLLSEVHCTF